MKKTYKPENHNEWRKIQSIKNIILSTDWEKAEKTNTHGIKYVRSYKLYTALIKAATYKNMLVEFLKDKNDKWKI